MRNDEEFRPHLGRMRARGRGRARKYLSRVIAAANLARGAGWSGRSARAGGAFGRARGVGRALAALHASPWARRVMIKARIVRLGGTGAAGAVAHLRYLERDGTTRAGERGQLYGAAEDAVDGKAFLGRGAEDRHQFRFIVSVEDGADYEDLKPLTRRLMAQAEADLGTRLDWVAVDHFNTGYPHTHVLIRGVDDRGRDLVIGRDYLSAGLRARASELVELDLGPVLPAQDRDRRKREMDAERLTGLDNALLANADSDRTVAAHARSALEQTLRAGRLNKLEKLGLARPLGGGRWRLGPDLEGRLRVLGERGDIIRTMQRAFARTGLERPAVDQAIYNPAALGARPLIGRIVERGLADEHRDHEYLILDGVDGRTHYVRLGVGAFDDAGDLFEPGQSAAGTIVRIDPLRADARKADHVIAAVAAANQGRYDAEAHLRYDPNARAAYVDAHVRRLEAMRRATRAVEREASGAWKIPPDYVASVEAAERRRLRGRPVEVAVLATMPLKDLAAVEGATWLDRELAASTPLPARAAGFGLEVRTALERRRQWLVEQGLAAHHEGGVRLNPDAVGILQRSDLRHAAGPLSRELGLAYQPAPERGSVSGIYRRRIDLVGGRFALIERAHDFTLVPWRPVLERRVGRPVSGVVRSGRIDWSVGSRRTSPGLPRHS